MKCSFCRMIPEAERHSGLGFSEQKWRKESRVLKNIGKKTIGNKLMSA